MKAQPILFAAAILLSACQEPTEIVVTVDTPLGAPCDFDAITFQASSQDTGAMSEVRRIDVDETTEFPLILPLVPQGGTKNIDVIVTAEKNGSMVAYSTATSRFRDNSSQELRFFLDGLCFREEGCSGEERPNFSRPTPVGTADCSKRAYVAEQTAAVAVLNACDLFATAEVRARLLSGADVNVRNNGEEAFDLPDDFDFVFYGRRVNRLWVSANGYVSFSPIAPEIFGLVQSLVEPRIDVPSVVPFAEDLTTLEGDFGGVCVVMDGQAPNRTLWITWDRVCFSGAGDACTSDRAALTFTVGLEERDQVIIGYNSMLEGTFSARARGRDAVIGVTTGLAEKGCAESECNLSGRCIQEEVDVGPCLYTQWKAKGIEDPTLVGAIPPPPIVFSAEN